MITRITIGERQGLLRLGDIGHGRLGEEAAAFELPYLNCCSGYWLPTSRMQTKSAGGVVGGDLLDRFAATDRLHDDQLH
jgi:hypothetical protein